jgi:DNA-binding response OmpR family regulator
MNTPTVKLLHVEDDDLMRRLVDRHLQSLKDWSFAITWADNESAALEEFRAGVDCVILDYHLTDGDGLSCLRRIRALDPMVPILALSGTASPETAAELVRCGADDYISKQELTRKGLAQSVRAALLRAEACRRRGAASKVRKTEKPKDLFQQILRTFAAGVGQEFLDRLDELETAARTAKLSARQIQRLFDAVCHELDEASATGSIPAYRLLRPIVLEVFFRLSYDQTYLKQGTSAP